MKTITINRRKITFTAAQERVLRHIARTGACVVSDLAEGHGRRTAYPCNLPVPGTDLLTPQHIRDHPNSCFKPSAAARRLAKDTRARQIAYVSNWPFVNAALRKLS